MNKVTPPSFPGSTPAALRILCADDDRIIREVVRLALERDGHQVTTVEDGSHAHELVAENPAVYDVVLTDHQMMVMTGLELVACLRTLPYHGGILVMSGSIDPGMAAEYRSLGVDALLEKPVDLRVLQAAVRDAAERHHTLPASL